MGGKGLGCHKGCIKHWMSSLINFSLFLNCAVIPPINKIITQRLSLTIWKDWCAQFCFAPWSWHGGHGSVTCQNGGWYETGFDQAKIRLYELKGMHLPVCCPSKQTKIGAASQMTKIGLYSSNESNWPHLSCCPIKKVLFWSFCCIHHCRDWKNRKTFLGPEYPILSHHQSKIAYFMFFQKFTWHPSLSSNG